MWELTAWVGHGRGWGDIQGAVAFELVTKVRGLAGGMAGTLRPGGNSCLTRWWLSPVPSTLLLPRAHRIDTAPGR